MTATEARHIVEAEYEGFPINEAAGNPNMMGWFLFHVKYVGWVWVTDEGETMSDEAKQNTTKGNM